VPDRDAHPASTHSGAQLGFGGGSRAGGAQAQGKGAGSGGREKKQEGLEGEGEDDDAGLHWRSEVPRPKAQPSKREVMQMEVVGDKEKGLAKQVRYLTCCVYICV